MGCFARTNCLLLPWKCSFSQGQAYSRMPIPSQQVQCTVLRELKWCLCHFNTRGNLGWQSNYQKWNLLVNITDTKFTVPGDLPGHLNSLNAHTIIWVLNKVAWSTTSVVPWPKNQFSYPLTCITLLLSTENEIIFCWVMELIITVIL